MSNLQFHIQQKMTENFAEEFYGNTKWGFFKDFINMFITARGLSYTVFMITIFLLIIMYMNKSQIQENKTMYYTYLALSIGGFIGTILLIIVGYFGESSAAASIMDASGKSKKLQDQNEELQKRIKELENRK